MPECYSRRQAIAAAGGLALLASAGPAVRHAPSGPLAPAGPPGRRRGPDWGALARQLRGSLLRPGEPGYAVASMPYNKRYLDVAPAGVALCAGAGDVRAALRWARDNEVPFAIRSGGHSYAGFSASRGLVISMARLNQVQVDRRRQTITLGAGARNRDIYASLAGTGLAAPSGRCPTVAVSGLLLGGGFGFSSRHLGLTCDHLIETELVTAAGRVIAVSEDSHPDLYWACRGGGGGSFGVNTRFVLRATPVGGVSVCRLDWDWAEAAGALAAMLELMTVAPGTLSCRVGADVSGGGPATGGPAVRGVSALGLYFGPASELVALLAPVLARVRPAAAMIEDRDYVAAQSMLARNVPFGSFGSKSRFLSGPLSSAGIDTLLSWIERWPGSSNTGGGGATIFAWGGAINRVAPQATAFVHRDVAFLMDNETSWTARDDPDVVSANLRWLSGIYAAMARYGTSQAYQNFADPALADWKHAYYGANLARLTRIKRRYDPDNVFRFAQSIPDAR